MTVNEFQNLTVSDTESSNHEQDEEYNIPIDITDIIAICQEFNRLGWKIQQQVENLLEVGVEESIKTGYVEKESLPLIKSFLNAVSRNAYFGDAVNQSNDCIKIIQQYEKRNNITYNLKYN